MHRVFTSDYRPLYFLSALGAGGMSVSVFMYLMFLVPHPDTPVPTFEDIAKVYAEGSLAAAAGVSVALALIAGFATLHVFLLVANIAAYRRFVASPAFEQFRTTNAEVGLMAVPLTYAMAVNVAFVLGAVFVPGLWSVVEFLLPVALVAFVAIGAYALALFGRYLTRILVHTGFDAEDTNHFSQVLPAFAFSMIAVGFSSSAAMSHVTATSVLGMLGTLFFLLAAMMWVVVKLPVSFGAILRKGMAVEAGPTLWMGIPILTLVGIAFVRFSSGIAHNFMDTTLDPRITFVVLGGLVAAQLVMGLVGWMVMRRQGYFATFVRGEKSSIPSYGLICPGVALSVLAMFFLHWGLVKTGVVHQFSAAHWLLLLPVLYVQVVTVVTMLRLNRKLLVGGPGFAPRPAAQEKAAVAA